MEKKKPRINLKEIPPLNPLTAAPKSQPKQRQTPNSKQLKWVPRKTSALKLAAEDAADGIKTLQLEDKYIDTTSNTSRGRKPENEDRGAQADSTLQGSAKKGSPKSILYEICSTKRWKPPVFECCKEEGPSHMKLFTIRAIVSVDTENTVLECYGAPCLKKKTAAEHTAAGAIWCLQNLGYYREDK